jgi:hypothetical protein
MQYAGRMISSFPSSRHRTIFFPQNPLADPDAHPLLDQLERRLVLALLCLPDETPRWVIG